MPSVAAAERSYRFEWLRHVLSRSLAAVVRCLLARDMRPWMADRTNPLLLILAAVGVVALVVLLVGWLSHGFMMAGMMGGTAGRWKGDIR